MIILASNSPRRKELLGGLDIQFRTWVIPDIDESYPNTLDAEDVAEYIAQKKAAPYFNDEHAEEIDDDDIVLTADTVVILEGEVMGKPKDENDACRMLRRLSGKTHHVITGVCLRTKSKMRHFSIKTDVAFAHLTDAQIEYYVSTYKPLDKAGAYGVQEWIGYVGVTKLEGSYFNVMGLPVQRIYEELKAF
ncbi:MAG: Maf-like protein [Bacteroidales bacterium]|nr:Maf-like protein [Bacteroidales bacterium]MCM1147988.1 Maf-like protein [Bacteroidales bacterium]MCM1206912.1 Maf-like protein [Bacillota bacterium]MCM1509546.1 Maf-like protein [Clostridium sp.]